MWNYGLHWWCQCIQSCSQEIFHHPEAWILPSEAHLVSIYKNNSKAKPCEESWDSAVWPDMGKRHEINPQISQQLIMWWLHKCDQHAFICLCVVVAPKVPTNILERSSWLTYAIHMAKAKFEGPVTVEKSGRTAGRVFENGTCTQPFHGFDTRSNIDLMWMCQKQPFLPSFSPSPWIQNGHKRTAPKAPAPNQVFIKV